MSYDLNLKYTIGSDGIMEMANPMSLEGKRGKKVIICIKGIPDEVAPSYVVRLANRNAYPGEQECPLSQGEIFPIYSYEYREIQEGGAPL